MAEWVEVLQRRSACREAVEYARQFPTFADAWAACDRGDWMLWWAGRQKEIDRRKLVKVACGCARLALPYVRAGEMRPLAAIELAERWANGEAVEQSDLKAADAAAAYADAADDAAADAAVAHAAAAAAYAAYAVAYAAAAAAAAAYADAAYAAAYAAANAAADATYAARSRTLKQCADIVRQEWPEPPVTDV